MFVKIKDDEILKVGKILRIAKEIDDTYEETEEYKNWRKTSGMFSFFTGVRYTDNLITTTYKLNIYIDSEDDNDLKIEYPTLIELESEFNRLWDILKEVKGE